MSRRVQAMVVLAFLLLLALPAAQMLTGAVPIAPLDENRARAPFPPRAALADPAAYAAALHDWFTDHYGFRDLLIRAKTQIDYSVFGASDRLHIGQDGFLFYRTVIDVSEPQIEGLTDAQLDQLVRTFTRLRDWLARRDIRLVVQTEQLKDRFYPEKLPREAQFARRRHRFDDIQARLAALPGVTYLDCTPMLEALKARQQIFHRTDFHWTDLAAFAATNRLVETLAVMEGMAHPPAPPALRLTEHRTSGGQAMFMPLFQPPSESTVSIEPTWDDALFPRQLHLGPFEWNATARTVDRQLRLPTTVIFGDSFVDVMVRAGLVTHFNQIWYARMYSVPFDEVMRALPPDTRYVMVEFIETAVLSWLDMKLPD